MAVKLRLARLGKTKQPFYKIVAADSRTRRDGKYIEKIGHYNPHTHPAEIIIDEEKAFYWLKNGAIPTDTVKSLFSQKGLMLKWHLIRDGHDETRVSEEFKKWELLQLERKRREEALAAQRAQQKKETKAPDEEPQPAPADEANMTPPKSAGSDAQPATTEENVEPKLEASSGDPLSENKAETNQLDGSSPDAQPSNEPGAINEQ